MASADASVKVIERALKMLNCFTKEKLSLSLVEIAREIDLPPSTTSRILATLEKYNYLYRDEETQRYFLGPSIARLGTLCYSHMDFRRIAVPYMVQLRELYNESVGLYVPNKGYRVCIERIESTHPLKRILNIGDRLPLTRGASGTSGCSLISRRTSLTSCWKPIPIPPSSAWQKFVPSGIPPAAANGRRALFRWPLRSLIPGARWWRRSMFPALRPGLRPI